MRSFKLRHCRLGDLYFNSLFQFIPKRFRSGNVAQHGVTVEKKARQMTSEIKWATLYVSDRSSCLIHSLIISLHIRVLNSVTLCGVILRTVIIVLCRLFYCLIYACYRRFLTVGVTVFYSIFMVALCNRADHYIFILFLLLLLSFFLLFFPRLISAVGDWMSTILRHMVWS